MPLYESQCGKCGKKHEYVRSIANCQDTPICCKKHTEKKIFTACARRFDMQSWEGYVSPSTGKWITSRAERKADMKASGCRDWEGLEVERKNQQARDKAKEAEDDKKLTEAIGSAYSALPPDKKKALAG